MCNLDSTANGGTTPPCASPADRPAGNRYRRDVPVVVPSRESRLIGPGIPMQVVVPSVSRAAVLQGTALTTFVEFPSGPTSSKPGPGYTSGTGPPNALFGASGP